MEKSIQYTHKALIFVKKNHSNKLCLGSTNFIRNNFIQTQRQIEYYGQHQVKVSLYRKQLNKELRLKVQKTKKAMGISYGSMVFILNDDLCIK